MNIAFVALVSLAVSLPIGAAEPARLTLLAHRGLSLEYDRTGIDNQTCTATRISPRIGWFVVENTLKSIEGGFDFGADIVEIDIHPTIDGEFVVFHDWTLECRTNGRGVTRAQTLAYLRSLDVGYGYTHDGQNFPVRGQGHAMPTWAEAMQAFPGRRFLINVKSNDPTEGGKIIEYLSRHNIDTAPLMFYGGDRPMAVLREKLPGTRTMSKPRLMSCVMGYVAFGWLGQVPETCRNSIVFVPLNYQGVIWGWPQAFVERMAAVNTEVFVLGPHREGAGAGPPGVDDRESLAKLAPGYAAGIMTDRIEIIGPALGRHPK